MITIYEFLRKFNKLGDNDFQLPNEYDRTLNDKQVVDSIIAYTKMYLNEIEEIEDQKLYYYVTIEAIGKQYGNAALWNKSIKGDPKKLLEYFNMFYKEYKNFKIKRYREITKEEYENNIS